jgi:O-antigen/teichoic acid export membrane protein
MMATQRKIMIRVKQLVGRLTTNPTLLVTFQVTFIQFFTVLVFTLQARLLGPRAFGIIALVMVVVGFCESVLTGAATDTLISVREIEERHFSTVTMATVSVSLLLGILMFWWAAAAARLFGDPNLAPVLKCMAVLPAISALWVAPNAMTKRALNFRPTVIRATTSLALGSLVGIVLSFLGAGVWALVTQALVHRATGAVALWLAVPLRFSLRFSLRHFGELRRIAVPLLVARCMSWASGQIPRFILGFYLGTVDLGLYSLGARFTDILVKLTIEPKTVVARISFRQFAAERSGLDDGIRRLLMRTSAYSFPLCVGGAAIAPTLFHVWLDARWQGGVVAVQLLLLSCVPYVTYYCTTAVLLALNERGAEVAISALQALTVTMIVLIAARFGLNAASGAISASLLILLAVPLTLLKRRCGVAFGTVVGAQLPAFVAAVIMGAAVWLIADKLHVSLSGVKLLLVLVVSGAAVYGAGIASLAPTLVREQMQALFALTNGATDKMIKIGSLPPGAT